jgi:hypothetical protein
MWMRIVTALALATAVACSKKGDQKKANSADTSPQTLAGTDTTQVSSPGALATADTTPTAVPAPAVTQASWAPDVLEELVAPIALYPDQLLGQILAASVNPQEVLDGGSWLPQNVKLKGATLDSAAQKAGFGPAMRALMTFPTVVDMMCQQIDWTRQLGSAFTSDQKSVLDAVQRLRVQAADVGNLKSTPQQKVERKTENDKVIVEVKPADPQVVYVPQYDPQVVYTTPPPAAPAPAAPAPAAASSTSTSKNTVSTGTAVAAGLLAFGVGVLVGNAMSNNNDYYAYPHWGAGAVFYGPRPFYPPAYVYRPVYGPAFRPAYRYAPPPNYRYRANNNTNIVINNNNYYNRFAKNQNLRAGEARSPIRNTEIAARNRPGQPAAVNRAAVVNRAERREQTRAVAPARTTAERRGAVAERANPRTTAENRGAIAQRANPRTTPENRGAIADRANPRTTVESRGAIAERAKTTTNPALNAAAPRVQAQPGANKSIGNAAGTIDRGYGTSTLPRGGNAGIADRPNRSDAAASGAQRDHALAGVSQQGSGSFDRAASARGHASTAERPQRAARRGRPR